MNFYEKMGGLISEDDGMFLHLEYRFGDNVEEIFEEVIIPETVKVLISDLLVRNLVLPTNLRVLDLAPHMRMNTNFNLSTKMEDIIIRETNIINKSFMELFPKNCRFRYFDSYLNGTPIYLEFNRLYEKYFTVSDKLEKNLIYYRDHSTFVEEIRNYEECVKQKKEICNRFKEELMMKLYHPDRVSRIIDMYGFDVLDDI